MSYVNKIGGNEISDDEARKRIDELRSYIYRLSYAVRLLNMSINLSTKTNGSPKDYYDKNKTGNYANGVNSLPDISTDTASKYFNDENKKNIL